jgi:hypothetical protein
MVMFLLHLSKIRWPSQLTAGASIGVDTTTLRMMLVVSIFIVLFTASMALISIIVIESLGIIDEPTSVKVTPNAIDTTSLDQKMEALNTLVLTCIKDVIEPEFKEKESTPSSDYMIANSKLPK